MHIKKFTQKDRYGNQMSYEFEVPEKGLDPTKIMEKAMETMGEVPQMMSVSAAPPVGGEEFNMGDMVTHPGGPKGSDTVPAWLTPGEFVVNAEAMAVPELAQQVEDINNMGRQMKNMGGPIYQQTGGMIDEVPFLAGPRLNDPQYAEEGDWVTDELLDRLAEVESGGRNDAVSPAGAIGKYQWLPSSAADAGYQVEPFDPMDEKAARNATRQYLKNMQQFHDFTKDETLRAYNWGPQNVLDHRTGKRKDMPDEAFHYPRKILDTLPGGPAPAPRPARSTDEKVEALYARGDQRPDVGGILQTLSGLFRAEGGDIPYLFDGGQLVQSVLNDPEAVQSPGVQNWLDNMISTGGSLNRPDAPEEEGPGLLSTIADRFAPADPLDAFGGEGPDIDRERSDEEIRSMWQEKQADLAGANAPVMGLDASGPSVYAGATPAQEQAADIEAIKGSKQNVKDSLESQAETAYIAGDTESGDALSEQAELVQEQIETDDALDITTAKAATAQITQAQLDNVKARRNKLQDEADAAREEGNTKKAEALDKAINKLDEKSQTLPREGETTEDAKGRVIDGIVNSPSSEEETGPGDDQPGDNAPPAAVEEAAKAAPPGKLKEAEGALKSVFGDLFNKDELKRMGIMYLGSRLLGYSHGGSLKWAAGQYVQRVDAQTAATTKHHQELVKSGKYTPESIQQYIDSGDASVLQAPGVVPKALGNFKTYFKGGRKVQAQEYDVNGQKVWIGPNGQRIDQTFTDDASTVRGTPEYSKRVKEDTAQYKDMVKDLRSQFGTFKGKDGESIYGTDLTPGVAGNKIAKWALENNVPPEEMGSIIENAYHSALAYGKSSGDKVRDITPFLEEQWITAQVGNADLFKGIDGKNVNKLIQSVQSTARQIGGNSVSSTQIMQGYRAAWNELDDDDRKQWERKATDSENGFMKFVMNDIQQSI